LEEKLYYFADTVIKRHDSVIVINRRLDTTVVETGIFTYLQTSYPVVTPSTLVITTKQAVVAEKAHDTATAAQSYQTAINFYQNVWLKRKEGFENGGFSDLNDYYAANVNVSILASYAFEKLGRLAEARAALAPFMANVEAENTRIQEQYVKLCIRQYGKAATRQALEQSGPSIHRLRDQSPESDRWRVSVFGADLGIADVNTDTLSAQAAQALVRQQPFWVLVK
jgi:hypothetical protein